MANLLKDWWTKLFRQSRTFPASRLLISDVDGTLLAGEEQLPKSTAELLRALHSRGVQIALASARPHPSIAAIAQQARIPAWIISLDGAFLHSPAGELRFALSFSTELLHRILDTASHYAVHYAAFTPEGIVQTEHVHIPSYLDDPMLPRIPGQLLQDFLQRRVVLLCFSGSQAHSLGFIRAIEQLPRNSRRQLSMAAVESASLPGTTLVELRMHNAHKGTAARALQQQLGLPRRATLAVGDYRNDLPLFDACGFRVAMADAVAELRSKADWVTERTAAERGIDEVLQLLLKSTAAP
ncbi:MAG: Cof-type HAD-IIB family hydrolase [Candidatus Kapabacteria bacterium]|nr:Cof-type HAD-IIB family hydrolase [Candidatus Kapabacteria bacterium]MDW7996063.1 HAD family hydrolase [Bacteroidota bacterium]